MQYLWKRFLWGKRLSLGLIALTLGTLGLSSADAYPTEKSQSLSVTSSQKQGSNHSFLDRDKALPRESHLPRALHLNATPLHRRNARSAIEPSVSRSPLGKDLIVPSAEPQPWAHVSSELPERFTNRHPDSLIVRLSARLFTQSDNIEAETEFYQQQVMTHPFEAEGYLNLGNLYYQQGNYRQALLTYLPALALAPDQGDLHQAIGITYLQMGRQEDANKFLQRASQLAPSDPGLQALVRLERDRRPSLEVVHNQTTLVIPPQNIDVYLQLGDLAWSYGDLDSALSFYQQANALQPNQTTTLVRLADLWMLRRDYQNAVWAYETLVALNPNDPEMLYEMGIALLRQDDFLKAQRILEAALALYQAQKDNTGIQKTARMLQML